MYFKGQAERSKQARLLGRVTGAITQDGKLEVVVDGLPGTLLPVSSLCRCQAGSPRHGVGEWVKSLGELARQSAERADR